ncbi:MAG: carboxypeptidase regulatory-like domain-containing protein [Blastocatellia bacterium]
MKSAKRTSLNLLLGIGLMISSFAGGAAQTYTATVTGSVTDTTGAVVPNVRVVAANQGTKLEYTAQSNADGVYTIPFLPIGKYTISIEASAFKKLVLKDIRLEVNQSARVDLKLEVGDLSETVTVTDVSPILQTENATVGQVISGNTMVNLPLNGRNFQQLTLLVPGTVTTAPGRFSALGMGGSSRARPAVNGNRQEGNAFLLDGISIDETISNFVGFKPNVDALAEFRVETSNSSSEFGNVTGAVVNATMKSGGNEFHG